VSELSRTAKVVILSLGSVLESFLGVIIFAVLSRVFTTEDYATYRQLLLCVSMATPFLALGIAMSLYYYLPIEKQNARRIIVNNLVLLSIMGSFFVFFIIFGGAKLLSNRMNNPDLAKLFYVIAPYVIIKLLEGSLAPCFMSANKAKLLAIFRVASRIGECALILSVIIVLKTLFSVVVATVSVATIALLVGVILVFRMYSTGRAVLSTMEIKRQLLYGIPLGISGVFACLIGYLDKLVVSLNTSPEAFAIYINGSIKLPFASLVVMSVSAVLLPELAVCYKKFDKKGMLELWQNAMIKSAYAMLPLVVFFMILANDTILLIFSGKYVKSIDIFRIFLILLPFQMISYGPIFNASNKNKYIVVINVITLVIHIPLLFYMTSHIGIKGAAIATVFSQIFVRIFLHIVFIGKIVECPVQKVIPFSKISRIAVPTTVLAVPLLTRNLFSFSPQVSCILYSLYYFPACYFWSRTKADSPRIAVIEGMLKYLKQKVQ